MNDKIGVFQALALLSQLGINMIVPIIAGVWVGAKIDQWAGTNNIFLLVFTVLGILVAFRSAYKLLLSLEDRK